MLGGVDVAGTAALARGVKTPVIASGGVGGIADIQRLSGAGIAGVVVGRALYEGWLDLAAALAVLKQGAPSC